VGRQIATVLLSALIGSLLGTLVWVAFEGGTGAPNPVGFVAGFAVTTLMFTIPGAGILMALIWFLAVRGIPQSQAAFVVIVAGTIAGAGMLTLFPAYFMALGAVFGFLTAVTFVCVQWGLGVYAASGR
jgi:hypothetical protein